MTALPAAPSWTELATTPSALFLDVDGTLLEFESHPDLVRATHDLVDLLQRVSEHLGGAVALISGRPLADLDRVFAPWQPYAAGGHGTEVRGPQGTRRHHADADSVRSLRQVAEHDVRPLTGVWVEDKGYGFAMHYRDHPEHEATVASLARQIADCSNGALEAQPGAFVQELRPAAFDKGQALDELMAQRPFRERRPVVVGDDRTDEFAFAAANRAGGVSILVGPRGDTVATYCMPDPSAVRSWLAKITTEVSR